MRNHMVVITSEEERVLFLKILKDRGEKIFEASILNNEESFRIEAMECIAGFEWYDNEWMTHSPDKRPILSFKEFSHKFGGSNLRSIYD